jgi:hypothetical protein
MSLVVYAEASTRTHPGHMVVGEEAAGRLPSFFGYRFDPADLPAEYRSFAKWREYLYSHAVPGQIVDESDYVIRLLGIDGRTYFERRAAESEPLETFLPPRDEWVPHGWYSFNPDDEHVGHQPCFNCVKWAIMTADKVVPGFLPAVPQGRLVLALKHLQRRIADARKAE